MQGSPRFDPGSLRCANDRCTAGLGAGTASVNHDSAHAVPDQNDVVEVLERTKVIGLPPPTMPPHSNRLDGAYVA